MYEDAGKEIVYEFSMRTPESFYLHPTYEKRYRKYVILIRILILVIVAEHFLLMVLDHGDDSFVWGIVPLLGLLYCVAAFLVEPHLRKKRYDKLHAAKEDCYTYTFYTDSVRLKTLTAEVTLAYDTAEFYAEDDERFMLFFPFDRKLTIDKRQCDEERLMFFRSIVPIDRQEKKQRKTTRSFRIRLAVVSLIALLLAASAGLYVYADRQRYVPEYQGTTYESFEACLDDGTIKDVVIVHHKYVEYTFTGHRTDERYYTVCTGDIDRLIGKLEQADVEWRSE